MSCVTREEWDTIDDDSLTEALVANCPNMDEFYRRVVSSDEEDCVDSDDGSMADLEGDTSDEEDFVDSDDRSVADLEKDTWAAACSSAFQDAGGAFPPEATDVRPAVVFSNLLFSGEELADMIVSVRGDVPISPVLQAMDKEVAMIPLVVGLVCWSLTSLCHSNGHIETMPAREINPFTALTRIGSQFLRTQ